MGVQVFLPLACALNLFLLLTLCKTCTASTQSIGRISPFFEGAQMNWIDNQGLFLLANNKNFAFGFTTTRADVTLFMLVVVHTGSSRIVWTANRDSPIENSDKFVFDNDGNVYLRSGSEIVWSTNTSGKGVTAMELQDSGNLVLLNNDSLPLWQSFGNPTDTLLSGQNFTAGMKLVSSPNANGLSYHLQITSGDFVFYANFKPPQPYWSMQKDGRRITNKIGGEIYSTALDSNTLRAYDKSLNLLWQFIFSDTSDPNVTWAAVLGSDGVFSFFNLQNGRPVGPESTRIPQDSCHTPEPCDPYYICHSDNRCQCPAVLSSFNCKPNIGSQCSTKDEVELVSVGDGLEYFATGFVPPVAKSNLSSCKSLCMNNCSCHSLFFEEKSGNCFLFSEIGSLQQSENGSTAYKAFIKVLSKGSGSSPDEGGTDKKHFPVAVIISIVTVFVIAGLIYCGVVCYRKRSAPKPAKSSSEEEDNFLVELSGMPIRFRYKDLQTATNNFTVKLGHGGFGSVYHGVLPDGMEIAVKKLESIGQGKKEFRAEVSIIGSIHHVHLVRLRGFCAEGTHRLLAYEYMAKGSLDRWIFQKSGNDLLDWDKRFNIALATAKGLAYLHEDCSVKIVHCDIKPENVLLDENFVARVSDFGLAKLMTREQSHVFTTLRGTRGYLAPEWITNYAISEKSDVYSFGMVLLEIIGGRKNYDPSEISEKAHFPTYAFKKVEERKMKDIVDSKLKFVDKDERISTAIKVALWCIQEDMHLRPSMTKVVQMLEGLCEVPLPPTSSQIGFRLYSGFLKSVSEEGTSSGPSDHNSDAHLSAVRLSGPR
ncbi:G-type lectin S-receptor-like serine/threonine-protein kinase SD2-5 [Aristolochia californica]|uniref:G-type lectin S-receptor-like serine/threonine-protein kinase SD2-5 n=1 Tax=Aristolochia californica TaxID=171875 RepID=UPI0035DB5AB8